MNSKQNTATTIIEPPDESTNKIIDINISEGIKSFALKNYQDSINHFSKSCEILSKHYQDDQHPKLIDIQLLYGKALVKNAVKLNSVLSTSNQNHEEKKKDKNKKKEEEVNVPGSSSTNTKTPIKNLNNNNNNNPMIHFSGDDSSDEDGDDDDDEEEEEEGGDINNEEEGEGNSYTADEEFESAFQILELVKLSIQKQILIKKEEEEIEKYQTKLIQVFELLAEVHQETECFQLALEAYQNSLEIKHILLSNKQKNCNYRSIAETHLYIALVYEIMLEEGNQSISKAIENIEKSIELVKKHINLLEEDDINKDEKKIKEEIEECKLILIDLNLKLDELKTVPEPDEKEKAFQDYLVNAVLPLNKKNDNNANEATVVNDLSNLVKKKKKNDESDPTTLIIENGEDRSNGDINLSTSKRPLETIEDNVESKRSKLDQQDKE